MATYHERLKRLHTEVWQQGKPFIRNFEGVTILDDALAKLSNHKFVLVRDEYARIWDHVLSLRNEAVAARDMGQDGLVVTGHHGIGKSLFLYYALGAALAARIPVVFCLCKSWCHIFDETGVKECVFARGDPFDAPPHALYLVDCHFDLDSPPSVFLNKSGVLVQAVLATNRARWVWKDRRSERVGFWVMDVWSRAEMQALQRTMEAWTPGMTRGPSGKAVYNPLELFDLLGPCPRQCIQFSGTAKTQAGPKADLRNMYEPSCVSLFLNINELLHTVCNRSPPPDFFDHDDLEYVLFLYNAHATNPSRTPAFNYVIPTLFLRQMLTDHLRSVRTTGRWTPTRIAAAVLHRSPSLAAALYQPLLVEHLLETRAGRFCNILDPDGDGATGLRVRLGPGLAHSHRAIDLDPGTSAHDVEVIEDECIFVPCTGCDAFDAVVVSEGRTRITLLRSAICAPTLELDTDAIRAAIDLFDRALPHPEAVRWSFVYAALDGDRAKNLAERDVARQTFVGVGPRLRVGWMKIATLERSTRVLLNAFETGRSQEETGEEEEVGEERPAKRFRHDSTDPETRSKSKSKWMETNRDKDGRPKTNGRLERRNTRSQTRTM